MTDSLHMVSTGNATPEVRPLRGDALDVLRKCGIRETRARVVILGVLLRLDSQWTTAEKIHQVLLFTSDRVSLTTCRRFLQSLDSAGVVTRRNPWEGKCAYFLHS